MSSRDRTPPKPTSPQLIPLQDLSRPPDNPPSASEEPSTSTRGIFGHGHRHSRTRSLLTGRRAPNYARLDGDSPTRTGLSREGVGLSIRGGSGRDSPLEDAEGFAAATVGLELPHPSTPPIARMRRPTIITTPADGEGNDHEAESMFSPPDNDTTPLTEGQRAPSLKTSSSTSRDQPHDRKRRASVRWLDGESPSLVRGRANSRLGDDLPTLETNAAIHRKLSTGSSIGRKGSSAVDDSSERSRSLSPSPSPIMARANSMLREISQRVVNLSNDSDMVERSIRRKSSVRERRPSTSVSPMADEELAPPPESPLEKVPSMEALPVPVQPMYHPNPLLGKTWGIFGPENKLRKWLCEILVHPWTEPIILLLIITQTVLLAVNAASRAVYLQTRKEAWGSTGFDYAIFALFIIYTLELIARTIVSGFISNPREFSTINRSVGVRKAVLQKAHTLLAPQHDRQVPSMANEAPSQPSIVRTFTGLPEPGGPGHTKQQQRIRLARRAFLRHSFNRLDFVAVVSYWISFVMQIGGIEDSSHVYVFNMLSCLRILRLLGLTAGTSIILRSLKKAAPLLVHVAFLICFFWLIFGIIGVQSFKSSLRRTCVWVGDDGSGQNYTQNVAPDNIQFCGGYLNAQTGEPMPWLKLDGRNGTGTPKGYLCPQNSICVEGSQSPYNGTVSFDNIAQSLELVFVIISSNTFSDLLYYLTDSDYLAAALFFAAGIVVLSLWLVNLLVAVITSSFQIIREESKQSAFTAEKIDGPHLDEDPLANRSQLKKMFDKTHWFWILLIVYDLVVQSLRSSRMSETRRSFIMNSETVVTLLLLIEIILRFLCDWRHFFRGKRNCFDLFLAVVTTIIQIPPIRNSGAAYDWLTAFQIARIYRVVLAVRVTRELVMIVFGNIVGLLNLILFVFLFAFLAAILASQLFRGDYPPVDPSGETIPVTFFDIWNSFLGMYQVFSSENWTELMYNATQFNLIWNTAWLSAIFFILWFIISNLIVLNMFIAVIQESFDVSEDEKRLQQVKAFLKQKEISGSASGNLTLAAVFKMGRESIRHRDALEYGSATVEQLLKEAVVKDFLDEQEGGLQKRPTSMHLPQHIAVKPGLISKYWGKITGLNSHKEPNPFYSNAHVTRANEEFDPRAAAKRVVMTTENRRRAQRQYLQRHPKYNVSLFIFKPHNPIRRMCQYLVGPGRGSERVEGVSPYRPAWYAFSAFTYAAIVAMVILACITTPLYQREYYLNNNLSITNWFVWTDLGFAILFSVEAIIKAIADGLFFTPHAYFRSVWGFIDGVVLITLWINVITTMFRDDGVSRAVGAFKALRALRLLNISDTARDTFYSVIIIGGYKVLAAAFVSMSLLIPFAILGVNLFNGKMQACNDGDFGYSALSNCVGEYNSTPFNWPVLAPRQVANPWFSFDDFGSALFILFQIVSQEGWVSVMWSGTSITGRGLQPQPFASQGNAVYFIIFNLLGAVFVLTLFISVFMRNYTEQTGVAFLTAEQRSWLELRKLLKQISPSKRSIRERSASWQKWCYNLSIKKRGKWQRFITTVLVPHLILLTIDFYPEPSWWETLREGIFLMFTIILIANIAIRIFGLGWQRFRRSAWDIYSIFAVSGIFITSLIALARVTNNSRGFDQLHKLFLVSVSFLLIPRNNQLDQLFKTAAASLPLIANLLATWSVLFLVYAIAFTQTFGLTRFGDNESNNVNFRTVPKALILLFRTSIGEGWNQIMEDYAGITPPLCVREASFFDSDCGSSSWARALFISWNIISMYIFVSLFVSMIFESFSYVYQQSSGMSIVSRDEIRRFKQAWADFDPNGTGYISKEQFPRLLGELSGVFSMRIYDGDFTVQSIKEDCSVKPGDSVRPGARIVEGIDLDKLAERVNQIPVAEIRRRRERMNVFYHEVMLTADPDRGIPFTACLFLLAHYNVITDSRSLRLEEFLRRRARLQRVQETIRRNTVVGFFDTLHWSRKFKQAREMRRNSRLGGPPSLPVPEIFIDNPDDAIEEGSSSAAQPHDFTSSTPTYNTPKKQAAPSLPPIDTSFQPRDSLRSAWSFVPDDSPRSSPVRSPRSPGFDPTDRSYSPGASPTATTPRPSLSHSRHGSTATTTTGGLGEHGIMESFDASAWGESIRRSFTTRRSRSERSDRIQ
ncbi:calcium channel protein [Exophiala dermatitidis]|uniref:Calcium-channel protein CCH1 n=1 Tax=Exophiala dermatitidis TaxID=5970 RepID=A0AAN6F279_EXODE|nr:calcium channel protein [Exophiala dermatitidis]KAJ4524541.1 calcium channel protein [Exophiala dermatitidis]KAJ4527394.1 calcium channel protein [Exophiala dermatitidis]KAJ4530956.1 calcium channel protein [Exophiala dermatitidis]KAJ4549851.1 calcium channel protein [Exophiala dermatitidis]